MRERLSNRSLHRPWRGKEIRSNYEQDPISTRPTTLRYAMWMHRPFMRLQQLTACVYAVSLVVELTIGEADGAGPTAASRLSQCRRRRWADSGMAQRMRCDVVV